MWWQHWQNMSHIPRLWYLCQATFNNTNDVSYKSCFMVTFITVFILLTKMEGSSAHTHRSCSKMSRSTPGNLPGKCCCTLTASNMRSTLDWRVLLLYHKCTGRGDVHPDTSSSARNSSRCDLLGACVCRGSWRAPGPRTRACSENSGFRGLPQKNWKRRKTIQNSKPIISFHN